MQNKPNHTKNPMTAKERIFHAVLFELGAIVVSVIVIKLSGFHQTNTAFGLSVVMAIMAMVWNVIFNYGFDRVFTGERLNRGIGVRILHVLLFEGGLLLFTVPVIAYMLHISLWQAFIMDIGLSITISIYAFIYNWIYDYIRYLIFKNREKNESTDSKSKTCRSLCSK